MLNSLYTFSESEISVGRTMRRVLYAMVPGSVACVWFFGWGILINISIATVVAIGAEAAMLTARSKNLTLYLGDCSAIVTAWLLAISLPQLVPWWITTIGIIFAIVVAKHLYGGLGYNPFNPAMIGYVILLISFPREMNAWLIPHCIWEPQAMSLIEVIKATFIGVLPERLSPDAITGATPLSILHTSVTGMLNSYFLSISNCSSGREWITSGFLAGGLWLVYTRTIAWQIPVGLLGGLVAISTVFYLTDPDYLPPWFHIWSGSTIFGAFFIATDPVTASTTPLGRLIYGVGVGVIIYIIRSFGSYPDGVAFAVLMMNIAAPTIDLYTHPRLFGAER
jgi:Na+-translocating ferredoxin:NAD+ oxidoreductase subunit D